MRGADDGTVRTPQPRTSATSENRYGTGLAGEEIYPPQPMVSQIRAVLDEYAVGGGNYREEIFANRALSAHRKA